MSGKHLQQITDRNGVQSHRWMSNDLGTTNADPLREVAPPMPKKRPEAPATTFHVTQAVNVDAILRDGLRASRGPRSEQIEDDDRVFVFDSRASAEDAVGSWLGEEFDEDEELVLLSIESKGLDLEPSFDDEESFEWSSQDDISPSRISTVSDSNL